MNIQPGHGRRQIKVTRRGYHMTPFVDVHWLIAGDIVSATAIYHDTGNGPPCTTVAIVHGKIQGDLHNSDNEATITTRTIMSGEIQKWRREKTEESLWAEAAIRLSLLILVEKLEAPSRPDGARVHPWIAEGLANYEKIIKKKAQ